MINRRTLFLSGGIGVALISSGAVAQLKANAAAQKMQGDYLFWLDESLRALARQTAESIVAALDSNPQQRLEVVRRLYAAGSRELQERYRTDEFVARIAQMRNPLGTIRTRVFQGIDGGFRLLPNLPDGEYCIVIFDVLLAQKDLMATEQLTLSRSGGAGWQLADYYVGEKPFYRY